MDGEGTRMIHEEKKVTRIVEELTLFFFAIGGMNTTASIERKTDQFIITITSDFDLEYQDKLQDLQTYLDEPKNDGMEDVYWELAGSGNSGESRQLLLVGMMVDKAQIIQAGNNATITLYRYL